MVYATLTYGELVYGGVEYVETTGLSNIFQSDIGYNTFPGDTPPNTHFPARVLQPFQYSRSLIGGGQLGGVVTQGFGDIIFANADASYDEVYENFAIDGREIEVRIGERDLEYDNFLSVWVGSADGWNIDESELRVSLRDLSVRVDVTLQQTFYDGTGGEEGTEDLEGSPKPLTFGECYNVSPIFVGIIDLGDGLLYTYQSNARPIKGHFAVYEGMNEYTEITSGTPAGGEWKDWPSKGMFQIGSTPVQQITCDVEGDSGSGGGDYVSTTADIIERILVEFVPSIQSGDLDSNSFSAFNTDIPGTIGLHITNSKVNASQIISQLLEGCFAFGGFTRSGQFQVGIIDAPTTTPDLAVRTRDMVSSVELLGSQALNSQISIPTWRFKVGYKRNWTVLTNGILSGADEADRQFAQQELRFTEVTNSDTLQRHVLATDPPPVESYFVNKSDATSVAQRLIDILSGEYRVYRVQARIDYTLVDLAKTVVLYYNRFNLRNGAKCIVIDYEIDANTGVTTLTLLKP